MSVWLKQPRFYGLLLMGLFGGCGSNAPTAPSAPLVSPLQKVTFTYVRQTDLNTYLQAIDGTLPAFYLIIEEQTVLFDDWSSGRTNTYWTAVFAGNLVLRIQAYSRSLNTIRPASPELKQLHTQLQTGVSALEAAVGDFITAIDTSDNSFIEQANEKIAQFNVAIGAYSISLSGLVGQPITLFPSR